MIKCIEIKNPFQNDKLRIYGDLDNTQDNYNMCRGNFEFDFVDNPIAQDFWEWGFGYTNDEENHYFKLFDNQLNKFIDDRIYFIRINEPNNYKDSLINIENTINSNGEINIYYIRKFKTDKLYKDYLTKNANSFYLHEHYHHRDLPYKIKYDNTEKYYCYVTNIIISKTGEILEKYIRINFKSNNINNIYLKQYSNYITDNNNNILFKDNFKEWFTYNQDGKKYSNQYYYGEYNIDKIGDNFIILKLHHSLGIFENYPHPIFKYFPENILILYKDNNFKIYKKTDNVINPWEEYIQKNEYINLRKIHWEYIYNNQEYLNQFYSTPEKKQELKNQYIENFDIISQCSEDFTIFEYGKPAIDIWKENYLQNKEIKINI